MQVLFTTAQPTTPLRADRQPPGVESDAFGPHLARVARPDPTLTRETPIVTSGTRVWLGPLPALKTVPRPHREAKRRADRLLNSLERLQRSLLAGAEPEDALAELRERLQGPRPQFEDLSLADILAAIEQRAAVELAKSEVDCRRGRIDGEPRAG